MANRGLGTLTLSLVAGIGGFTGPMDAAARNADKNFRKISDSASKFGKALGAGIATAAIAATTALIGITKAAIDNADAIRDLSIRTGIGTETLSAYGYAASQTGTSIESLAKGLNILAKNAAAAINPTSAQAKIFDALGISVTDAEGKLKDLDQLVPEIATRFKGLEDGTTKTALALKLLGRSGVELTEFFNLGADGIADYIAKARELGIELDEGTGAAADQLKDTLAEVKASVGGLGLSIARELLPALQEGADDFKELVKQGDLAHNIVTVLSAAFSVGVGAINAYSDAVKTTGAVMDFMVQAGMGWQESVRNIWAPWSDGTVANGIAQMRKAMADGDKALADIRNPKKNPFSNVTGGASTFDPNARRTDERALGLALSNPRAASSKKAGKSDAEKEAEALLKAYQSMEASYREQIALVGDVTEVERLRYELVNGEGKKFTEEQKATLLGLAAQKDAVDAANKQLEEGKALTESLLLPFEQVNEERAKALQLLNDGIISQETYNRALEDSLTPAEQMLDDLKFETELLGKTREQQELLTAARLLGAEAATTQGQAAIQALKDFQEQAKATEEQIELMDGVRDAFGDFFTSIIDGSKSAKDALKDLVSDMLAQITRLMVNKAIEQFFGAYGSNGQGTAGGNFWASLFGSAAKAYGGGMAAGGITQPGMFYRVNENGPEMLSVSGKDYLMMGSQGGMVTPTGGTSNRVGGGITQQFITAGLETRRTTERKAQLAGRAAQRAMARNGR